MPANKTNGAVLLYLFAGRLEFQKVHETFGRQRITSQESQTPKRLQFGKIDKWTCALIQTLYGEYGGFIGSERHDENVELDSHSAKERDEQMVKSITALNELFAAGATDLALYLEVPYEASPSRHESIVVEIGANSLLAMPCNRLCMLRPM